MRRLWAAGTVMVFCLGLGSMLVLAQEPSTEIGDGSGVLTVTLSGFPWEEFSGKELGGVVTTPAPAGFLEGVFLPVDGTISASIPGPSAEPAGVRHDSVAGKVGWSSSVSAQLQLDGQPVHLGSGVYTLVLSLGEAGCLTGYPTCEWGCRTSFDLRSDEDIWIVVWHIPGRTLWGSLDATTCPVALVAHRPPPVSPAER